MLMPVGPIKVEPETVQLLIGLVVRRAISITMFGRGHVVNARNEAWRQVVDYNASARANPDLQLAEIDRVLWIDTDVSAPLEPMVAWLRRCDERFEREPTLGWISPVVARKGGGWAYRPPAWQEDVAPVPLALPMLLGLGIGYWHVPRILAGLEAQKISTETPFNWVPPYNEDTGLCMELAAFAGCSSALDPTLPTAHEGAGEWPGGELAPHEQQQGGEVTP